MEKNRKKDRVDNVPQSGGWELVFCSLSLILVALFALLVSYSSLEKKELIDFLRGFGGSQKEGKETGEEFKGHYGINLTASDFYTGGIKPSESEMDEASHRASRGVPQVDGKMGLGKSALGTSENYVRTGGDEVGLDDDMSGSSGGILNISEDAITKSMKRLKASFEGEVLEGKIDIERTPKGFKATLGSSVLFPSGVATFNDAAYPSLDRIVKIMKTGPYHLRIEGHTDNVPINTSQFPSNWELSTARAVNVLRYFLGVGKISSGKITAVGYSEYHPVATNETPEGRTKNRRVEFYFELHKEKNSLNRRLPG